METRDPEYVACSFALGAGKNFKYCTGDTRFPSTHQTECPFYVAPGEGGPVLGEN